MMGDGPPNLGGSLDPMSDSLAEKLAPTHLAHVPNIQAEESAPTPEKPKPADPDAPKRERVYAFDLDYTDGNGKHHRGSFESHALSMQDRQRMAVLEARFGGGQPWECLPPQARSDNMILAHLIVGLKKRPKWAEDLQAILDPGVIYALFQEVASHEAIFLGRPSGEGEGRDQDGESGD